ncbi:outer membrane protein [Helicobacter salomonis]|uniref:OMP1266 n=1 Tax=Helicobacter salomonis TaxID=56878 RepID=A0A1M4NIE7_9HELI|nr:outer membrane protein [Helicobacter salomonis]SFZ73051.1 OMP1266 [Helicobacter salomonis]
MKLFSSYKRSLSVALAACFNFVPSLDATEVDVINVVNSISGLLGGSYQLSNSGTDMGQFNGYTNSGAGVSWGSGTPAGIYSLGASTPLKGSGVDSTNGSANGSGSGPFGNGNVNNPFPHGIGGSNNYNLYGQYGLLNDYAWRDNTFYNIYDFPKLGGLLSADRNMATIGYTNRLAFSGLLNGTDNILNPGTAVTNNIYYTASGGGNLTSSQLANGVSVASANTLLGTIYGNIQSIAGALSANNLSSPTLSTYNAYYDTAFSSIQGAGTALLAALGGTATSGFTLSDLNAINTLTGNLITKGVGTNPYSFDGGNLGKLEAYNGINSLVSASGGISGGTTLSNGFSTVVGALTGNNGSGAGTAVNYLTQLQTIANDTLNVNSITNAPNTINDVISALSGMHVSAGTAPSLSQVASALQGLVNPNAYAAVYQAYAALTTGGSVAFNASTGVGTFAPNATPANRVNTLSALQGATGASSAGAAIANVLQINSYLGVTGAIDNGSAAAIAKVFNGGDTSPYQALVNVLKSAGLTVSASPDYTPTTDIASSNVKSGSSPSTSPTTKYPYAPSGATYAQSWTTAGAANQTNYVKALAGNIASILSPALNYSSNASALKAMLSSSTNITNILNAGINNAADTRGSGDLSTNAPAQTLNNIKAIFYSQDLLSTYVGAITAPQSGVGNQQAQASALTYLNNALGAQVSQNGLIAQTRKAISGLLNTSFNLTGLSNAQVTANLSGVSSGTFNPSATPEQIAAGIGALEAISQVSGYTSGSTLSTAINTFNTLNTNIDKVATAGLTIIASPNTAQTALLKAVGLSAGEKITAANVGAFLQASIANGNTTLASTSDATVTALIATGVASGSLGQAASLITNGSSTTIAGVNQLISLANAFAEPAASAGNSNMSAAIQNITALLSSSAAGGATPFGVAKNADSDISAVPSTQAFKDLVSNAPQLMKDLSLLGPSIAKQFENGTIDSSALSTTLQNIRNDYQVYYGYGTNSVGGGQYNSGNVGQSLNLGNIASGSLQSLIYNVSVPQNLGLANAAVNTIATELNGISSFLASGDTFQQVFGTASGSTTSNALTALSALNSAVGKLWAANPTFFHAAGSTAANTAYNLSTTGSLGNNNANTGIANATVNSIVSTNATDYLTNLQNFSTLTNLLGNVVESSGSTSSNYQSAFTISGQTGTSLVSNIATQGAYLVSSLKPGVQLSALIQTLQNISSSDPTANNYANVASAIADLTTGTIDPSQIWKSFHALAQATTLNGGTQTPVQALYGIISGATSGVTGDANSKSALNPGSTTSGFNAAGVAQMIQDGIALNKANNALAGKSTGTISSTTGLLDTTAGGGNAAAYLAAQSAANAYGQLLNYLNTGSQNSTNAQTFIKALNAYNHNLALLNNLTNGKGASIASEVVNYASANKNFGTLAVPNNGSPVGSKGKPASISMTNTYDSDKIVGLNQLQTLVNRLQYLEGLQNQIQTAINKNPYALLMEKNYLTNSASYQGVLKGLLTSGTGATANTGLFNQAVSTSISNATATAVPSTYTLSGTYSSTIADVTADLTNISDWNDLINGLNGATGAFIPGISYSTQIATQMGNALGAVNNLISAFAPGQDSGDASALTTSFGNLMNAYSRPSTSSGGGLAQNFAATGLGLSTTSNFTNVTAGDLAGQQTVSGVPSVSGKTSPLQVMQDVWWLQNNIANSTANAATAFTTANGLLSINGSNVATINGNIATLATNISALNTQLAAVTTALGSTALSGTGVYSSLINPDPATNITKISNVEAPLLLEGLITQVEANATLKPYLNGTTAITGAGTTILAALGPAITSVVGSGVVATLDASKAETIMTALKDIALTTADPGSTTLGAINGLLNTSSKDYAAVPAGANKGANVLYSASALQTMISAAHKADQAYLTANSALKDSGTAGLAGWVAANTGANAAGWLQAMQTLLNGVKQVAAPFDVSNGAIATTSTSSTAPAVSPTQAVLGYVSVNGSSNSTTPFAALLNATGTGLSNSATAATQAAAVAGQTPAQQITALVAAQVINNAGGYSKINELLGLSGGSAISSATSVATVLSDLSSAAAKNPALAQTLFQAAQDVVNSFGTYATNWSKAAVNSAMQSLTDTAANSAISQAAAYTTALSKLAPLLNSGSNGTSAQDILQAAVNNTLSLNNLLRKLNGSATLDGTAISSLPKTSLSPAVVAAIKTLLGNLATQQGKMTAIDKAIAANPAAQALSGLVGSSGKVTELNNALSQVQSGTMTVQGYDNLVDSYVSSASGMLIAQGYNVKTLLYNLKGQLANVSQYADSLNNVSNALTTLYDTITGVGLSFSAGETAINNAISMLTGLQQQLLQSLASGGGGNQNGDNMQPITKGDPRAVTRGTQAIVLAPLGNISQLTPAQKIAALKAIQNALTFANAAKTKYADNGASFSVTGVASNAPAPKARKMVFNNSSGNMYGVDVQFGYKQFFGKRKRWGLRYYAHFSYQHGTFMDGSAGELDNFVYGAGVDALYNFYESKDAKYTSGLFAGLILAGSTWNVQGASYYKGLMADINANGGKAVMNTSYFQVPLNIGFRTNVSKHHGFEIGLRIPLAVNYYFKGTFASGLEESVSYKRNVSVFFNYVYNF